MLSAAELAALRREYAQLGLRRAELDPDPMVQFNRWLAVAAEKGLLEPNAMVLATVDEEGQPWTRTVLLKICDGRGFTFFTNYESAKGRQLAARPRAALTFLWAPLERQVNITGTVRPTTREESAQYFHSRPAASQWGAWASRQSSTVQDRAQLEVQLAETRRRFGADEPPLPPFWGGYTVCPQTVEFWQGRESRLHDRLRYTRRSGGFWEIERISP